MRREYRRMPTGRPLGGLILIVIGVGLLLNAMNIFPFAYGLSRLWPGIFILLGIARLSQRNSESTVNGCFWIGIGILGIAVRTGFFHVSVWQMVGPLILIWLGLLVMMRRSGHRIRGRGQGGVDSRDWIDANAILGGANILCTSQAFRGGDINSIMGGFKIDLRDANMVPEGATLEVNVIMGGIELIVPNDWTVESRADPVLGGYEDSTRPPKDGVKRLAIEGTIIMGGFTVRN